MYAIGVAVTVFAVVMLWVAAVVFGRDSRDGGDWGRRSRSRDHSFRPDD